MKKLFASLFALFSWGAFGADITLYYSPTCPHCHHAREFISNNLVYEYPELRVTAVDVVALEDKSEFLDVLKKCEYTSGGVPVMVIGDKCFQGYADFMQDDLRAAIEVDMSDSAKSVAVENKKAMDKDADAFRAANSTRANAVSERVDGNVATQKKIDNTKDGWVFYAVLILLVAVLGFAVLRKNK